MTVFKGYLRSAWHLRTVLLQYAVIYLILTFLMVGNVVTVSEEAGGEAGIHITVVDADDSVLSRALCDACSAWNQVTVMRSQEEDRLQEELYYGSMDAVVQIPRGFQEQFLDAQDGTAVSMTGRAESIRFQRLKRDVEQYLLQIRQQMDAGETLADAAANGPFILLPEEKKEEEAEEENMVLTAVIRYLPYPILSMLCFLLGYVVREYQKPEIRDRLALGAMSQKRQWLEQLLAFLVVGFLLFLLLLTVLSCISGGVFLKQPYWYYHVLNLFCMILVGLALAFLVGVTGEKADAMDGMVNVIIVSMCFLGGVILPEEYLGAPLRRLAHYFPTYWYEKTAEMLAAGRLSGQMTMEIVNSFRMQVLMAAAIAAAALALGKMKRQRS